MRLRTAAAVILTVLPVLCCCTEPADRTMTFVKSGDAADGEYVFTLPMTDSLGVWDLWLYTRVDGRPVRNLPLSMLWESPEGDVSLEVAYMDECGREGRRMLYKKDFTPAMPGEWKLKICPLGSVPGLRGMGLISEKRDGTR